MRPPSTALIPHANREVSEAIQTLAHHFAHLNAYAGQRVEELEARVARLEQADAIKRQWCVAVTNRIVIHDAGIASVNRAEADLAESLAQAVEHIGAHMDTSRKAAHPR